MYIILAYAEHAGKNAVCKCILSVQLIQVFKTAHELGGMLAFSFEKEAHLTEKSKLLSRENKQRLIQSWKRYWHVDKFILAAQSPRFATMTRFLQVC